MDRRVGGEQRERVIEQLSVSPLLTRQKLEVVAIVTASLPRLVEAVQAERAGTPLGRVPGTHNVQVLDVQVEAKVASPPQALSPGPTSLARSTKVPQSPRTRLLLRPATQHPSTASSLPVTPLQSPTVTPTSVRPMSASTRSAPVTPLQSPTVTPMPIPSPPASVVMSDRLASLPSINGPPPSPARIRMGRPQSAHGSPRAQSARTMPTGAPAPAPTALTSEHYETAATYRASPPECALARHTHVHHMCLHTRATCICAPVARYGMARLTPSLEPQQGLSRPPPCDPWAPHVQVRPAAGGSCLGYACESMGAHGAQRCTGVHSGAWACRRLSPPHQRPHPPPLTIRPPHHLSALRPSTLLTSSTC